MQRIPRGEKGYPCPARVTPPSTAKVQKDPNCPGSGERGDSGGSSCDGVVISCDAEKRYSTAIKGDHTASKLK